MENFYQQVHPVKYRKAVIPQNAELFNGVKWLLQEKYAGKLTPRAKKDIARLKTGEPLDYIIGFIEFLGCKIDLSKKPLIPRLETEFWAEKVIEEIVKPFAVAQAIGSDESQAQRGKIFNSLKILDMFAGSGAIGVSIMSRLQGNRGSSYLNAKASGSGRQMPNTQVTFADSEKNCIEQIAINCKLNHINKKRYKIIQSDVFSNIKGAYDVIVANPPYIPKRKKHKVQISVLDYEPEAALFGGKDGLFYTEKFLAEAKNFLSPGGQIFMEFDSPQKNQIGNILKKYHYKKFSFHKDQFGKFRYVVIQ